MSLNRHIDFCIYDEASTNTDKFERVGSVQALGGIDLTAETNENTPYGSDQGDYRGFDYGLKDAGELSATIRYESANANAQVLADAFHNGTKVQIALKFPAAQGKQFQATVLVTKLAIPMDIGAKTDRQFTMKIDGEPTFATLVPLA
mgnify:CR=1 FL=1|jgi:hypothetical protein